MRGLTALTLGAASLALAACDGERAGSGALEEAPAVPLVNTSGEIIGQVRGGDSDEGARLLVEAQGLPPGIHAMHIHDIGICEPPSFESAGPHWNPTAAHHGHQDPGGPHLGDLRNVTVGGDGRLRVEVVIPTSYLRSEGRDVPAGTHQMLDASGASLVIHQGADDYRSDPAGNSGARIACAELGAPAPGAAVLMEDGNAAASDGNAVENAAGNAIATNATGNAAEAPAGNTAGY